MNILFKVNDYYDISEYVLDVPEVAESVNESISTDNEIVLNVVNKDNWCNLTYENSIFYGNPLSHFYITAYDTLFNDKLLFKGVVSRVKPLDSGKSEIALKNNLTELEQNITTSYYYKTIKEIFEIFRDEYSINIDLSNVSILQEQKENYLYSIRINEDEQLQVKDLITTMSENLGVFIYSSKETLYIKPYYQYLHGSYTAEIDNYDILNYTKDRDYSSIINQYEIKYYLNQETPITDTDNIGKLSRNLNGENPVKEIDASQQSNFVIMSKDGAKQSGNNYIYRFKDNIVKLNIELVEKYYWYLEIGEFYLIDNKIYQLISKSLNINGSKTNCEFWEVWEVI